MRYADPAESGRRDRHSNNYSKQMPRNMAGYSFGLEGGREGWLKINANNILTPNTLSPSQCQALLEAV